VQNREREYGVIPPHAGARQAHKVKDGDDGNQLAHGHPLNAGFS
jgi:hypothetical protein